MICSTIITTINRPTLQRAVRSVVEQGLGSDAHEILIFNNSPGALPDADWLRAPHIKVIDTRSNAIDATNEGLARASGKYIKILHDDDFLLAGALQTLIDVAERSGCAWVYGAYHKIDDDGALMSTDRPPIRGNVFALLLAGEGLHLAPSLLDRQVFLRIGGVDARIRIRWDQDLNLAFAMVSDFERTDEVVASVRIGRQGSSVDWRGEREDWRRLREKWLDYPGVTPRIADGVRADVELRGRVCRHYLFSAALNLGSGRLWTAAGRLSRMLQLAGLRSLSTPFWRGMRYTNHWDRSARVSEEQHYSTMRRP